MIGAATLLIVLTRAAAVRARAAGACSSAGGCSRLLLPAAALPFVANTAGWIFTEMGRQPWVVQGLLQDLRRSIADRRRGFGRRSRMAGFTLLYGVLAVIGFALFARTAAAGPDDAARPTPPPSDLILAY